MKEIIQKFFGIDEIPQYIIEEFEKISDSFNPCAKECIDEKFIFEFYSFNEKRIKRMKSKAEDARRVSRLIASCIKQLIAGDHEKLKTSLIEAAQNSSKLSFNLEQNNKIISRECNDLLRDMNENRKKYLLKFKRTPTPIAEWEEDPIKREPMNLIPIIKLSGQRCHHGFTCAWNRLWKLLSNEDLPLEFCQEVAKISRARNFTE